MTRPSADGTADVCRLVLCEVPLPPLLQFSASEDPRAGHVPVSKNFPENLLLPSEHLTVLVRTRRGPQWLASPMHSPLPCLPQPHTHTLSPLTPLVSYVPMKTPALPPFQLFSLRTYQLSQLSPREPILSSGLSGEVPMWPCSGQDTLWCFPVIPRARPLIKPPTSFYPGCCPGL